MRKKINQRRSYLLSYLVKCERKWTVFLVKETGETDSRVSRKKRKYDHNYLKFGFSWIAPDDAPRPQCVICKEVLANASMRPCKLRCRAEVVPPTVSRWSEHAFGRLER